jgi:hypothetical protein
MEELTRRLGDEASPSDARDAKLERIEAKTACRLSPPPPPGRMKTVAPQFK